VHTLDCRCLSRQREPALHKNFGRNG
jgi:hypothetical protein